MEPAAVAVEGLSHRYRGADRLALDDVSFTVVAGLRLGLLGPNGAGKTTLMRILCGFIPAQTARAVRVGDCDVRSDSIGVRERVGYLPELVPLYPELRVAEHLAFRARLKRVPWRGVQREVERVAEMTGIEDKLGAPIGQLSRGYRQRVGIADALLGSPPLLILDEPTVGLDPNQVRDIRAMLRSLGGSHTLVFSSHILAEVESLCDRVVILAQGKVVADESLDEALAAGVIEVRLGCPRLRAEAIVAGAWQKLGCDRAPAIHFDHRDLDPDEEPATGREPERGKGRDALDEGARAGQRKADSVGVRIVLERGGPLAADALRAVGQASHEAGVAVHELCEGKTRLERRFASVTTARADRS